MRSSGNGSFSRRRASCAEMWLTSVLLPLPGWPRMTRRDRPATASTAWTGFSSSTGNNTSPTGIFTTYIRVAAAPRSRFGSLGLLAARSCSCAGEGRLACLALRDGALDGRIVPGLLGDRDGDLDAQVGAGFGVAQADDTLQVQRREYVADAHRRASGPVLTGQPRLLDRHEVERVAAGDQGAQVKLLPLRCAGGEIGVVDDLLIAADHVLGVDVARVDPVATGHPLPELLHRLVQPLQHLLLQRILVAQSSHSVGQGLGVAQGRLLPRCPFKGSGIGAGAAVEVQTGVAWFLADQVAEDSIQFSCARNIAFQRFGQLLNDIGIGQEPVQ